MEEKELFDLCKEIGEIIYGSIHIINTSTTTDEEKYRVYNSDGYCFDIGKVEISSDDDTNTEAIDGYEYTYFSEWDGFKEYKIYTAISDLAFLKARLNYRN